MAAGLKGDGHPVNVEICLELAFQLALAIEHQVF